MSEESRGEMRGRHTEEEQKEQAKHKQTAHGENTHEIRPAETPREPRSKSRPRHRHQHAHVEKSGEQLSHAAENRTGGTWTAE